MTRWDAARAASRRPLRKPIVMHGPVGPSVVMLRDAPGALVNGARLSREEVFSLGVDVPEMGISAFGPNSREPEDKRGDGRPICRGCGYHVCSCERHVTTVLDVIKAFAPTQVQVREYIYQPAGKTFLMHGVLYANPHDIRLGAEHCAGLPCFVHSVRAPETSNAVFAPKEGL